MISYGVVAIGAFLIILITGTFAYRAYKPFKLIVNRALLTVPILGPLAVNYHMSNFCRTLGLLLNCQVNIIGATNITAAATANPLYQKEILS